MTRDEVEAIVWAYMPTSAPDPARRVAQIMAAVDAYALQTGGPNTPEITAARRAELANGG